MGLEGHKEKVSVLSDFFEDMVFHNIDFVDVNDADYVFLKNLLCEVTADDINTFIGYQNDFFATRENAQNFDMYSYSASANRYFDRVRFCLVQKIVKVLMSKRVHNYYRELALYENNRISEHLRLNVSDGRMRKFADSVALEQLDGRYTRAGLYRCAIDKYDAFEDLDGIDKALLLHPVAIDDARGFVDNRLLSVNDVMYLFLITYSDRFIQARRDDRNNFG